MHIHTGNAIVARYLVQMEQPLYLFDIVCTSTAVLIEPRRTRDWYLITALYNQVCVKVLTFE